MEVFYTFIFGAMAALAAVLELTKSKDSAVETGSRDFMRFRNNYVLVYALMMGAPASGQHTDRSKSRHAFLFFWHMFCSTIQGPEGCICAHAAG